MKIINVLISSMVLVQLLACNTVTYNGAKSLNGGEFNNLHITGHAKLHGVTVKGIATFPAALEAYNSSFNIIDSRASVECHGCKIQSVTAASLDADKSMDKNIRSEIKNADISNKVIVKNSNIGHVTFRGVEAQFINCVIGSITNNGYAQPRIVILVDSNLTGDISFESIEPCKVVLKGNSKILGKVKNATVIYQ